MLKLRPHHLNCLPRFMGKGYSKDFCVNMQKIKARFEAGEEYTLVFEADDVCSCCPNLINGICKDNEKVLMFDRLSVNEKSLAKICSSCEWFYICKKM